MNSNDMYVVVNNEQQFRLYVVEQFGKIDARMSKIESRLDGIESRVGKLETQTSAIMLEQAEQRGRLGTIQNNLSIWGTIICGVTVLFAALPVVWAVRKIFAFSLQKRMSGQQ